MSKLKSSKEWISDQDIDLFYFGVNPLQFIPTRNFGTVYGLFSNSTEALSSLFSTSASV